MPRALKVCSCLRCDAHEGSCPELIPAGRCPACTAAAERARGTASQRGYGHRHRTGFRRGVLAKNPLCVCVDEHRNRDGVGHGTAGCLAPSVHADHWPRDRTELVALGLDADDPKYGRGLCGPCHSWRTSRDQPGGWRSP